MIGHITALYAGLLGLIYVPLSWRIARMRFKYGVGIGDGGNKDLARAIRVHGNFSEYVPLALVLLLVVESIGSSGWVVHVLGVWIIVARLAHAQGLNSKPGTSLGRFTGILLTWLQILAASLVAIAGFFGTKL